MSCVVRYFLFCFSSRFNLICCVVVYVSVEVWIFQLYCVSCE